MFASADLLVFPSETDTAGNVVLEAQASGLPVVVSERGGPKENMRPDVSGVVCGARDADAWAIAIAPYCARPDMRETASRAAREYALSRRWDLALAPLYESYRELGNRRTRCAA